MIHPEKLYNFLKQQGVEFFTGVPDSLLKYFLKYLQDHVPDNKHLITANEGLAIGLAAGYNISTGKIPLVYLQNSGLGNIINPLTSLADKEVYSIPMVLMIGWRGRPGTKDEPQHKKMGRITISLLDSLEVPYYILDQQEQNAFEKIKLAIEMAAKEQKPVALLVPEEIFEKYEGKNEPDHFTLVREDIIKEIIQQLKGDEIVVCTTGKMGREFNEQNIAAKNKIKKNLLSVGAMGHANHIALGIKMNNEKNKMIMLDGDGALLMHMGSLSLIPQQLKEGFIHIVINNGSHESVGGQPTSGFVTDLCGIAKACGYNTVISISNENEFKNWIKTGLNSNETQFVEIRTCRSSRNDLGRPAGSPIEWKNNLITALHKNK
jgi:phosphonopyruvate decarboxylase